MTLLKQIKETVQKEKQLTAKVITLLEKIEKIKLYSQLKYPSLSEFCIRELGYSEDQAWRRINAMRLSAVEPKIKEKIQKGNLSLTNATLLTSIIKDKTLPKKDKHTLIEQVSNTSKRECETLVHDFRASHNIEKPIKRETVRMETSKTVRLNVSLSKETYKKLDQLKGYYPKKSTDELISYMADILLKKREDSLRASVSRKPNRASANKKEDRPSTKDFRASANTNHTRKPNSNSRYIPKTLRSKILQKGHCENCKTTKNLQIDHIKPFALGGKTISENLRLLCQSCNIAKGVQTFGYQKMRVL